VSKPLKRKRPRGARGLKKRGVPDSPGGGPEKRYLGGQCLPQAEKRVAMNRGGKKKKNGIKNGRVKKRDKWQCRGGPQIRGRYHNGAA